MGKEEKAGEQEREKMTFEKTEWLKNSFRVAWSKDTQWENPEKRESGLKSNADERVVSS